MLESLGLKNCGEKNGRLIATKSETHQKMVHEKNYKTKKKLSKEKSAWVQEKWPFMEKDSSKENRSDNSAKLHSRWLE